MAMTEEYWNYLCTCERCGYVWKTIGKSKVPTSCAKCKSKGWNKPRVYSGKYVNATICQRTKPTGRKAANEKQKDELFSMLAKIKDESPVN